MKVGGTLSNYFMVNDIIRFTDNEAMERILWIDDKYSYCYTIDLTSNNLLIYCRVMDDLKKLLLEKSIFVQQKDPFFRFVQEDTISEKNIEKREKAFEIVQFVITDATEPSIYTKNNRRKSIIKAVEQFNIGEKIVYKYLKKYWKAGRIKNALLPDTYKCGGAGKRRSSFNKLGRPSNLFYITGERQGINVNEEMEKIFEIASQRYYFTPVKRTFAETYRLMLDDFYSKIVKENGENIKITLPDNQKPTFGQFKNWFYNIRDKNPEKEIIARKGEKDFLNNYKGLTSSSDFETIGPGSIYQIDATMGDVYLVNRFDRTSIIGRPIVYIAVDVFSRVVTALHVALEGPNWNGVSTLIYNFMEDKVEYCNKYGISINEEEWNVKGLPSTIVADRGETIGPIAQKVISHLSIEIANTPSYLGAAKGLVEQYFKTINLSVKHWTPGAIKKEFRERGDRDYRLDAKLDIVQFTQLMIYAIIKNNKRVMRNYKLSKEMVADDIKPVPLDLWNWGIKNKSGSLKRISQDILKLNLMRTDKALVTEGGIKFQNRLYICERATNEQWFSQARIQSTWYVDICHDNRDITQIYIIDTKGNNFEVCTLREDYYNLYSGLTDEEFLDRLYMEEVAIGKLRDYEDQNNLDYNEKAKKIIEKAEEEAQENNIKKNSIKNIRENRKEEKVNYGIGQALKIADQKTKQHNALDNQQLNNIEEDDSENIQIKKLIAMKEKV